MGVEWGVTVGVGGVGGTIRLRRTALFYRGLRSRGYRVRGVFSTYVYYRKAKAPFRPLPPTPPVV